MDDSDNPFRSPDSDHPAPAETNPFDFDETIDPRTIGKAKYVPTIAILMIVHGVLLFAAGLALISMIFFVTPQIGQQIERQQDLDRQQNPNAPRLAKEEMVMMLNAVYGGFSAVLFCLGSLNCYAGIRNYRYRNRILGIFSLIFSLGSILFCWCLPLSIGLLIFGLIIYLSPEADRAFRWQSENIGG